jgi:hypothetical protein
MTRSQTSVHAQTETSGYPLYLYAYPSWSWIHRSLDAGLKIGALLGATLSNLRGSTQIRIVAGLAEETQLQRLALNLERYPHQLL